MKTISDDWDNLPEPLDEAIITLGKKLYPKFGNVVIMAGGAASGKGFVVDKLLGLEGRVLDVDQLKLVSLKCKFVTRYLEESFGKRPGTFDPAEIELKNPRHTSLVHDAIKRAGIQNSQMESMVRSILFSGDRKPNIIYDVTLKDMEKFHNLSLQLDNFGYDKRNVHIVWVLNDFKVASQQNDERDRRVSKIILKATHAGSFRTMQDIIQMGESLVNYMNGDIWVVFNKRHEDSVVVKSGNVSDKDSFSAQIKRDRTEGSYVSDANMFKIKAAGVSTVTVPDDVLKKMLGYAPR